MALIMEEEEKKHLLRQGAEAVSLAFELPFFLPPSLMWCLSVCVCVYVCRECGAAPSLVDQVSPNSASLNNIVFLN